MAGRKLRLTTRTRERDRRLEWTIRYDCCLVGREVGFTNASSGRRQAARCDKSHSIDLVLDLAGPHPLCKTTARQMKKPKKKRAKVHTPAKLGFMRWGNESQRLISCLPTPTVCIRPPSNRCNDAVTRSGRDPTRIPQDHPYYIMTMLAHQYCIQRVRELEKKRP